MKDISNSNFGLLIAYALPGFVVIWGLSGLWPVSPVCLGDVSACSTLPSLVGFFNTAVGAITAGMVVSAIRFVLIDTAHHLTGLQRPALDGATLQQNIGAVNLVVDNHYRYYQFHANLLIAGSIAYAAHLYQSGSFHGLTASLAVFLGVILWLTTRDNLRKYYRNLATFNTNQQENAMSNGMSSNHKATTPVKPKASAKKTSANAKAGKPKPKKS